MQDNLYFLSLLRADNMRACVSGATSFTDEMIDDQPESFYAECFAKI